MARRKPARAISTPQKNVPTIIEFLLDETGSMHSCATATVDGFNDFLSEQKSQIGTCLLTLTKFDTRGQRTPYTDIDIQMVPPMIDDWFNPGASTNLRETIAKRLSSLKERLSSWTVQPNVLIVVMTDGDDNASGKEYTKEVVRSALKLHMNEGWTFVYLGADQDTQAANELGFPEGNIKSFASNTMRETMQGLAKATTAYRAGRTTATATATDFFNEAR